MDIQKELLEEYKRRKVNLQTVSEDVIRADVIRKVIYKRADLIAVGTRLVGLEQFDNLDVKWQFPAEMTVDYPVAEGARSEHGKVTWTDFTMSLGKAEGSFMITDEAQIRGLDRIQYTTGVRRLSEAMASEKDENIISTLYAGRNTGNDITPSTKWDAASPTPETDIANAIGKVLKAKGVTNEDLRNLSLVCHIDAWRTLLYLREVRNVVLSTQDYLRQSYPGLEIWPSKSATLTAADACMLLLRGPDTGIHGTLRPPAGIPLVETKRHEAVGMEYIVRQFFQSKVVPESAGLTYSTRICALTDVLT